MAEWTTLPLPDVLDFREGPGILARDFRDSGVPLIRLAGLKRNSQLLTGCNFLDPDMVDQRWNQFRVLEGDVLLSTSASLGEVATVDASAVGAVPYTGIIRFRPRNGQVRSEFISHMLTAPSFKKQIEAMGVGSVMRHFGPSHLRQMTVDLPRKNVQQQIAAILGALDDKITVNDHLATVAEALSAATYEESYSQSPGDFAEHPLTYSAQFINGRAFTKNATGTGRMVIRIAEVNSGPGASTVYNDLEIPDKHLARPGDILFAWSGSLTVTRWYRAEGIVNQHIFKVVPNEGVPAWLAFRLVKLKLEEFRTIAADKATTMGHIQRRHLEETAPTPNPNMLEKLDSELRPLWERALAAEQESLALAALRDTLLPQLMSGKLRVRDAERIVEDAV